VETVNDRDSHNLGNDARCKRTWLLQIISRKSYNSLSNSAVSDDLEW